LIFLGSEKPARRPLHVSSFVWYFWC